MYLSEGDIRTAFINFKTWCAMSLTTQNKISIKTGYANPAVTSAVLGRKRMHPPLTPPNGNQCCWGLQLGSTASYKEHVQSHENSKWSCHMCKKEFSSNLMTWTHVRSMHKDIYLFKCPECGKGYDQHIKLAYYCEEHHEVKIPYHCTDCREPFLQVKSMTEHAFASKKTQDTSAPNAKWLRE